VQKFEFTADELNAILVVASANRGKANRATKLSELMEKIMKIKSAGGEIELIENEIISPYYPYRKTLIRRKPTTDSATVGVDTPHADSP
jgi:hypothetical protein